MKKLTVKDLVDFKNKSDRSKRTFADNIKKAAEDSSPEGGGDYWISCLSAISNAYKQGESQLISQKRDELETKIESTEYERTKNMYKRNVHILNEFENVDLNKWKPIGDLEFLKKGKDKSTLTFKNIQIKITPHHVFSFTDNGIKKIGAIWFIAQLKGFRREELGMFNEALKAYLDLNHANKNEISSEYCITVDLFKGVAINYSQLETGSIPKILNSILDELRNFTR